ncbi:hypothetical protein FRC07_009362 [Ceratobasidium sp. 392]|nr:hypothetical protein FRC07_009362 [Ceratobasidium sp. 392]
MWTRAVSIVLVAASFVSGTVADVERRDTFTSCLTSSGSGGTIVTPSSPGLYNPARAAFNQRLSFKPAAIAYPKSAADVQKYVKCAASSKIAVVARSGGHSYAAYGVGGQDGALVIDLRNMKSLTVDASGAAKVQTGNRLGDIAQKLWDNGKRALPHGTCPYVGSGGHTAFGGFGPFSRVAGLLHDRVTAAEVVLANGTLTTASATQNSDLFWALRGAGASYGIVTQWTFATLAAPTTVIGYSIEYSGLSGSKMASLLNEWQKLAIATPKEMAMICAIGPDDNGLYMEFTGDYYGTKSAFNAVTANWSSLLSPGKINAKTYNWYDSLVQLAEGSLSTSKPQPNDTFYAKSLFTKTAVTSSRWTSFSKYLESEGTDNDTDWFVEIDQYGGAVKDQGADATSFAHRDAILSFQLYASSIDQKPPYPSDGIPFVNGMLNALEPNPQAAYVNYVDPLLTADEWKTQYYGSHYSRLSSIKRAVDPNNVFRFPQSIGLS